MPVSPCSAPLPSHKALWRTRPSGQGSSDLHPQPEPASVSTGEGYGAAQASSETDLLNRFILLTPKPSQGDSSEAKTPAQ